MGKTIKAKKKAILNTGDGLFFKAKPPLNLPRRGDLKKGRLNVLCNSFFLFPLLGGG